MTEKPIAIVTGVGPGTGAAIVKRFSAGGFRIIALARSAELINRLAQELPDVHAVACDVSEEAQVRTAVADVKRRFGAADVLIHNAVGGGWGSFREIDPKMLKGNFEVNVMGLLYLAREVAPEMKDNVSFCKNVSLVMNGSYSFEREIAITLKKSMPRDFQKWLRR